MIKLLLSLICLLPIYGIPMQADEFPYDKIANQIRQKTIEKLSNKYKLRPVGLKGGMQGCINIMGCDFQLNRKMEKDEARAMLVDCMQEFLADINKNVSIRKYLKVYPFDDKHFEVTIFLSTPDHDALYYPDYRVVSACNGQLSYFTKDPQIKYGYKSEEYETYKDAVKIVQGQQQPQPPTFEL